MEVKAVAAAFVASVAARAFGAASVIARVAMMLAAAAVKVMIAVTIPAGGSQDVAALLWLVLLVPQCLWLCVADGVVAVAAGIA